MTTTGSSGPPERRQFFRIADEVLVAYRPLGGEGVDAAAARARVARAGGGALAAALDDLGEALERAIRGVEQGDPQLAQALRLMDRKLTLLAAAGNVAGESPELTAREVSLSGGGMALPASAPVASGTALEIDLVLLPGYEYLKLFGRVVDCRRAGQGHVLGVAFEALEEVQRERIMRHVFAAQARALRGRGG